MPVLPAVPSTIKPPGLSRPRFSASRMMYSPARSFTEPPGFRNSALPRISQPVSSDGPRRRMSGVLPIAPTSPSRMSLIGSACASGASAFRELKRAEPAKGESEREYEDENQDHPRGIPEMEAGAFARSRHTGSLGRLYVRLEEVGQGKEFHRACNRRGGENAADTHSQAEQARHRS